MARLWGKEWRRSELISRVGDMRQIAGTQAFELSDGRERGVRVVRLTNAAGLALDVILERGMAIGQITVHGIPIAYRSPVDVAHPSYAEHRGLCWLRTWPAGFLTTCGLTQVGSPCVDNGEELGLHGRIAAIPASNGAWGGDWQGDDYVVWVEGEMHESTMFGVNLILRRRIWLRIDEPRLWIEDRVENRGFEPAPHMFLQHFNLGFPLVSANTLLELPEHNTRPRDEAARKGAETCLRFSEPEPGYQEQVFYHYPQPGADGRIDVRLFNPAFDAGRGLGIAWRYAKSELPILVEWKMMGQGFYVIGIEPANCHVEGRCKEREMGSLILLKPGEVRSYTIEVEFSV